MNEEKKSRKKRKISIITVFLWLLLIVAMSVITIGSIQRQNAVEDSVDKVTIKLDMSEIDDEILSAYSDVIESDYFLGQIIGDTMDDVKFIEKNDKIYTYELKELPAEDFQLYLPTFDYYENGVLLDNEMFYYYKEIKIEELKAEYIFETRGEKVEITIQGENLEKEEERPYIIIFNKELNDMNISDLMFMDLIYPMVNVSYENGNARYIGIRTNQSKIVVIGSLGAISEHEAELEKFAESYVKELTQSNEYFFKEKRKDKSFVRLKLEGMSDVFIDEMLEEIKKDTENIKIYQGFDSSYPIEPKEINIDLENNEAEFVFDGSISSCLFLRLKSRYNGFYQLFLEKNGGLINVDQIIDVRDLEQPEEYDEINLVMKLMSENQYLQLDPNTYATEQIRWVDSNTGKAEIILGNQAYLRFLPESFALGEEAIYTLELNDQFVLSAEYENHLNWKILDLVSAETNSFGCPLEIVRLFQRDINLNYIYVKNTNTIYWRYHISDYTTQSEPIYVYYQDLDEGYNQEKILKIHQESVLRTGIYPLEYSDLSNSWNFYAELKSPNLGFQHLEERNISIEKNGEDGVYYVGLFEDNVLSKVEKLEIVNGFGSVQINLENYDENINYTIYEVDENGNKIEEEGYIVHFENKYDIRNTDITSNNQVISSVKSGIVNELIAKYTASIEESEGTGEADYVDNVLSVTDIYQVKVTIGEEKVHKVTYETEEGGKLEGETEEYVKDGETPEKVPTPVPDEGYEFDKWIIVENGEEIEVDPNTYVPTKDVTFIAKFKKIDKIVDIDTSDIQVWVYVVVVMVAVIGIVVVVLIVRKNKIRK